MVQSTFFSADQLRFFLSQIKERLWVRPLAVCLLSIGGVFLASMADDKGLAAVFPEISLDSVQSLLTIMASSMLVIATFAVGSMVAAYASATTSATPRSFSLVVADDVTQNALSAFIGAFIFSLVSLIAVKNEMFGSAGLFAIFMLTVLVFVIVIGTFVRWVDRIARLGRVVNTIEKVENATCYALDRRRRSPALGALSAPIDQKREDKGVAVFPSSVGYVQHIDMETLQSCAETSNCRVLVNVLPGNFVSKDRALLFVVGGGSIKAEEFSDTFEISRNRSFEDDPRFGLLALSEIADRALSPAVNDPGTAINVIGTMVRLFTVWQSPLEEGEAVEISYDRISVPKLTIEDLFDDAFTAIARDGAGLVEVALRLQKALHALAEMEDAAMTAAAKRCSRMALARSEQTMSFEHDIERTRKAAAFSEA